MKYLVKPTQLALLLSLTLLVLSACGPGADDGMVFQPRMPGTITSAQR